MKKLLILLILLTGCCKVYEPCVNNTIIINDTVILNNTIEINKTCKECQECEYDKDYIQGLRIEAKKCESNFVLNDTPECRCNLSEIETELDECRDNLCKVNSSLC